MAFLKIYCSNCRRTWHVYERGINDSQSRICPNCGQEIDRQTWKNQVVPALEQVADANRELKKDNLGYPDQTLFRFSVIEGR